jgi:hypothetical protein
LSTGATTGVVSNSSIDFASFAVSGVPGVSGSFTAGTDTVTVTNGIITGIV